MGFISIRFLWLSIRKRRRIMEEALSTSSFIEPQLETTRRVWLHNAFAYWQGYQNWEYNIHVKTIHFNLWVTRFITVDKNDRISCRNTIQQYYPSCTKISKNAGAITLKALMYPLTAIDRHRNSGRAHSKWKTECTIFPHNTIELQKSTWPHGKATWEKRKPTVLQRNGSSSRRSRKQ